jgi:cAMP-dependent protein kinase regulator
MRKEDHELCIKTMISLAGTLFTTPEEFVVQQGEKSNAMYFLVSGDCMVFQQDLNGNEHCNAKLLTRSDHFGEIGILYNCERTCTIRSVTYNILARISKPKLRQIMSDYPEMVALLIKNTYTYKDSFKSFFMHRLKNIDYLCECSPSVLHTLFYKFKRFEIEQNEILLKEGDPVVSVVVLLNGELEVIFVDNEGNEIVLQKMSSGAILNSRNWLFREETM